MVALERLTVVDVWKLLGLKGTPKPSCRSPFRDDRIASFSIYDHGRRWKDHATGECGDAANFVAKACRLSPRDGAQQLIEMAGVERKAKAKFNNKTFDPKASREKYDPLRDQEKAVKREKWPVFEVPTSAEVEVIAQLRGLSRQGVALAVEHGLLYCADSREGRAWVITDLRRLNAQWRLLNGLRWEGVEAKAQTLPGSMAAWPIGLHEAAGFRAIALVEGGPDLLAALHLAWCVHRESLIAPVAILGASNAIPQAALPLFEGKYVRLFPHGDKAGQQAGKRWGKQLLPHCLTIDVYLFEGLTLVDGSPAGDFNDFVHVCPDQWEDLSDEVFDFVTAIDRRNHSTPVDRRILIHGKPR